MFYRLRRANVFNVPCGTLADNRTLLGALGLTTRSKDATRDFSSEHAESSRFGPGHTRSSLRGRWRRSPVTAQQLAVSQFDPNQKWFSLYKPNMYTSASRLSVVTRFQHFLVFSQQEERKEA